MREPVNGWSLFHSFMYGYGVMRKGDRILAAELPDRLTLDEFVRLKAWRQDAIITDLKARQEERRKVLASAPILQMTDYQFPVIRTQLPDVSLSELISHVMRP